MRNFIQGGDYLLAPLPSHSSTPWISQGKPIPHPPVVVGLADTNNQESSHLRGEACTQRPTPWWRPQLLPKGALAAKPAPLGGRSSCAAQSPAQRRARKKFTLRVTFIRTTGRPWKTANSSIPSRSGPGVGPRSLHFPEILRMKKPSQASMK